MKEQILKLINSASIESRIEVGYRYWVNESQLYVFKPILEQASIYDYAQFGAVPLSNMFVTREERDRNNQRITNLIAVFSRKFNIPLTFP